MNARAWSRFALVLLGAVVLQISVLDNLVVHDAHPDVMLLVAIAAGLTGGAQRGAIAAFVTGLVADLFVDTPYGASALAFVLVAFAVGLATAGPGERPGFGMQVATAVLASAGGTLLYAGIGYVLGEPLALRGNIAAVVAVVAAGNAILAAPVFKAVNWAMRAAREERADAAAMGVRVR